MQLTTKDTNDTIEVGAGTFDAPFNEALVHQVVTAYLAGGRAGTKAQKTRSEVRGGGRKPWKQKGTGRARAGTIRSPLWRSGGRAFAAKPRDHSQKVNKKMYRRAMATIFSELCRSDRLQVVSDLTIDEPKTKLMLTKLNDLGVDGRVLLLVDEMSENLFLSARNLRDVAIAEVAAIDPVTLVGADHVVATKAAVEKIAGWLK